MFPFSQTLPSLCTGASDFSSRIDTLCLCRLTTARISLPGSLILPFSPGKKWSQAGEDGKAAVPFPLSYLRCPFPSWNLNSPTFVSAACSIEKGKFLPRPGEHKATVSLGQASRHFQKAPSLAHGAALLIGGPGLLVFSYAVSVSLFSDFFFLPVYSSFV